MSETILWLYDLTAAQLAEAKDALRTLLRPADDDTALLHLIDLPDQSRRYDLCLSLKQSDAEAADLASLLSRVLDTPFESTHTGLGRSLWRFIPAFGLHFASLDEFGSPVLSEPFLVDAIGSSRGNGVLLSANIRRGLGMHFDEVLEAYRVRSGSAKTRNIRLAS